VAGGAGAIAAASMFEMNVIAEQNVKNRTGAAVVMEGRVGGVEFYNPLGVAAFENHANPGHLSPSGSIF
jgi:hypothetical protein